MPGAHLHLQRALKSLYQKNIAFQADAPLVRDAHLYTGRIQGQDLALEFDKSTVPTLNITYNAFNNMLFYLDYRIKKT